MACYPTDYTMVPLNEKASVHVGIALDKDNNTINLIISSYVFTKRTLEQEYDNPKEMRVFRINYEIFINKIVPLLIQGCNYIKQAKNKTILHDKQPGGLIIQTIQGISTRQTLDMRFYSIERSNKTKEQINTEIKNATGIANNCLSQNGCRLTLQEVQNLLCNLPTLNMDYQKAHHTILMKQQHKEQSINELNNFLNNNPACAKYKQDLINCLK